MISALTDNSGSDKIEDFYFLSENWTMQIHKKEETQHDLFL